MENPGIEYRP